MHLLYVKGGVTLAIWVGVSCALIFSKAFSATEMFSCYAAALLAGAAAYSTKQIWNPEKWSELEAKDSASKPAKTLTS
jgi:hypothetical protein